MKIAALAGLACIAAAATAAQAKTTWMPLGHTPEMNLWVNPDLVKEGGGRVRIWQRQDLETPDHEGAFEYLILTEVGCKDGRLRYVQATGFSDRALGHAIIGPWTLEGPPAQWRYPVPGSADARVFETACRRASAK
jgi:hypothetical protein